MKHYHFIQILKFISLNSELWVMEKDHWILNSHHFLFMTLLNRMIMTLRLAIQNTKKIKTKIKIYLNNLKKNRSWIDILMKHCNYPQMKHNKLKYANHSVWREFTLFSTPLHIHSSCFFCMYKEVEKRVHFL